MTGTGAAGPDNDEVGADRPAPATSPARAPRPLGWRIGTPVVALLSGALFMISAADSGGTDLRPGRYTDLASLAEAEREDVRELQERGRELEQELEAVAAQVDSWDVSRIRGRIEVLEDPAGMEPKRGPGVTIVMHDAPQELAEEGPERDIDVNRFVVHQQDLQAVVNALWRGGAEAVTIAGQRVISTTGIKCEGSVVQLQGLPYPQPYVIQAVGDQADLVESVESDPIVAGYLTDAGNPLIGIGWELELEDDVEAPPYDGLLDLRYAEPLR